MRHHHKTENHFSPLSYWCLLILLSESCHYASSTLDESKADWTSDFEEAPPPAFKRASSYVRFGKRSDSVNQQEDAESLPRAPNVRRSDPSKSLERASRASSYVRFGKRGGPPSRSFMIPQLHDSQMDDSESLPYQPLPCTLSYLSTLATFEEKYAHIRQCTGARRVHAGMTGGMSRATRGREASYVRYG